MTKTNRATKLYSDSPSAKRDEKTGKVGITRPSEQEAEANIGDGEPINAPHHAHERREMHHRHVNERLAMHHRHEMEHARHEGGKAELHDRHEAELEEMHGRHHQEMEAMHTRHEGPEPKAEEKK